MSYEQAKALMRMGPSRPALFRIQLPVGNSDYISFFCTATAIPEARLNTILVPGHEKMGVVRDQPTAMMFGKPFSITVIENSNFDVYRTMRDWHQQTVSGGNGTSGQRMVYQKQYVRDFELIKLENSGGSGGGYKQVLRVKFINAFPLTIGAVSLGAGRSDAVTEFQVDFTYETYQVN